jgi:hypothetical protein
MSLLQYITPSSLYNHLRNLWRNNRPDADVELARKDSDASTEEVTEEELGLLRQAEECESILFTLENPLRLHDGGSPTPGCSPNGYQLMDQSRQHARHHS